jgi:hypothetical protein
MTNHPKTRLGFTSRCERRIARRFLRHLKRFSGPFVGAPRLPTSEECAAVSAEILSNGHRSDFGFVRTIKVQFAAGDCHAGRIEKQEVKSGFFSRNRAQ